MAKKRTSQPQDALPAMEVTAPIEPATGATETVTATPEPQVKPQVLGISVPAINIDGYARKRVDVNLTGDQAQKLKSIQHGLESKNAQLTNGRFVSSPMHAIQWMLENAT